MILLFNNLKLPEGIFCANDVLGKFVFVLRLSGNTYFVGSTWHKSAIMAI